MTDVRYQDKMLYIRSQDKGIVVKLSKIIDIHIEERTEEWVVEARTKKNKIIKLAIYNDADRAIHAITLLCEWLEDPQKRVHQII